MFRGIYTRVCIYNNNNIIIIIIIVVVVVVVVVAAQWPFLHVFNKDTYNSNYYCKDQIWVPSPKGGWTKTQKAQNNEFIESGLENWVLVNRTISKVDLDDKRMKMDKFKLKKIVLDIV